MGKFRRLHFEFALAVASGAAGIVTLAAPRWIETVTGLEIDGSSDALELALAVVLLLVGSAAAVSARRRRRQAHTQERQFAGGLADELGGAGAGENSAPPATRRADRLTRAELPD
jgi:hypothetical protein